ncbi:hypothetical protein AB0M43_23955 [Longispora sp. NPDC051575]|uniref:hypothetical protein n=1 Tax=Longispora sp. NPDC051575 TaxID=3154943 RepID=UPI003427C8A6
MTAPTELDLRPRRDHNFGARLSGRAGVRQDQGMAASNPTTTPPDTLLDRAGVAALTGKNIKTVDYWYWHRDRLGFPEHHVGVQWRAGDILQFVARLEEARKANLTAIDYDGDPNDIVNAAQAAKVLGYKSRTSLRNSKVWDKLVEKALPSSQTLADGRTLWEFLRKDVWQVGEEREGKGTGQISRKPVPASHRNVDRNGDPEDIVPAPEAARILGYTRAQYLPAEALALAINIVSADAGIRQPPRKFRRGDLIAYHDQQLTGERVAE